MNIHYLPIEDAWYFPDVSLNVYRKTIDNIDPSFLAHILNVSESHLNRLLPFLREVPSDIVHKYEVTFVEDEISPI